MRRNLHKTHVLPNFVLLTSVERVQPLRVKQRPAFMLEDHSSEPLGTTPEKDISAGCSVVSGG